MGDANVTAFHASVGDLKILQDANVGTAATRTAICAVFDKATRTGMSLDTIRAADERIAGLRNTTDPAGAAARDSMVRLRNAASATLGSGLDRLGEKASAAAYGVRDLLGRN